MLTETEARDLLARAAATIDVPTGDPVGELAPRRRRWLVPAVAAAAVVAVIATVAVVTRDEPADDHPPITRPTPPLISETRSVMPSVFAYDAASAEAMLRSRGLVVTTKPSYTCRTPPGRAIRTNPATGARVKPGDSVTLFVTQQPPTKSCASWAQEVLAWQVLDFANHRGPAPAFASEVQVYVDNELTTMTGEQAADPESWGQDSALGLLAGWTREEQDYGDRILTPSLVVNTDDGSQFACGGQTLPKGLQDRPSVWFNVQIFTPGFVSLRCPFTNIFETDGRIDAIVQRTSRPTLGGTTSQGSRRDADPDGIGARFLAYARGQTNELPVDTPVRLYVGNEYRKTINAADVADRASWNVCATYAERRCPVSAVNTLRDFVGQPTLQNSLQPEFCLDTLAQPPTDTGASRFVVLRARGASSCSTDFAVQIWSNDVGQITAVNLLLGSP